jgi:hypothetical protein
MVEWERKALGNASSHSLFFRRMGVLLYAYAGVNEPRRSEGHEERRKKEEKVG